MRIELDKMLEKLGVSYVLSPYETMPWMHYDEEKGQSCSAEVRMGPTGDDVEAEIQIIYDNPEDAKEEEDEKKEGEGDGESGDTERVPTITAPGQKQIMWMRADSNTPDQWGPKLLRIKGKSYVNEFHDWEGKGCDFFRACVESLQMGEIPDFDDLIGEHMKDDSFYGGGRRGRIGRKSPNVKPGQLLGMKK